MSSTPQQQPKISYIDEDTPNTVNYDISAETSSGPSLFGIDFLGKDAKKYFTPQYLFQLLFILLGIGLAFRLSWKCSFAYNKLTRVAFGATAAAFNWLYVIFHFIFQSQACHVAKTLNI